jgi:hypothetical protein
MYVYTCIYKKTYNTYIHIHIHTHSHTSMPSPSQISIKAGESKVGAFSSGGYEFAYTAYLPGCKFLKVAISTGFPTRPLASL